jgi:predicted transcriptional regulator YdeE
MADAPSFERYAGDVDPVTGHGGVAVWIPVK